MLKRVFFIIGLLIIYGSLYPFNFHAAPVGAWAKFFASWHTFTGRGDALSNILLFAPFGYFAVLAYGRKVWLIITPLALAVGVQVLQIYLPGRDANLQDVFWNMLGTGLGGGMALLSWPRPSGLGTTGDRRVNAALLLIGSWLAYRLMPFVPSIDWQQFKDSLKPLLLHPQFSYVGLLHDAVAWAVVAYLWSLLCHSKNAGLWLLILISGVFSLEVLIVKNTISLTNVLGAALGVGLWWLWLRRAPSGYVILILLLMLSLLLSGLAPFQLRTVPGNFYWLPFHGFLGGSMMINISVVFEKGFFYGALILLLQKESGRFLFAVVSACLLTLTIEIGQVFVYGRTAEITDPVLVLLIAMALRAVTTGSPVRRVSGSGR
ncbi:MAG: VanZ family protein [Gammaproteobacteria bacterium]|nr:VanZ family protein [Gammaproteobacteria bacterium]